MKTPKLRAADQAFLPPEPRSKLPGLWFCLGFGDLRCRSLESRDLCVRDLGFKDFRG